MEIHTRRNNRIQDQENIYAAKGKGANIIPGKRLGLGVRGALGDVNTNVQVSRDLNNGKVANAAAEFEKKASLRGAVPRSYGHVQSKIDTGLACKPVSTKAPLRREESTACMARAASRLKVPLKDTTNKVLKSTTSSTSSLIVTKKTTLETKKTLKGPTVRCTQKEKGLKENKPTHKYPTESLGKLKLAENVEQRTSQENVLCSPEVHLPHDIEDIDSADMDSPILVATYIKEIYKYLLELELKYPIVQDHLKIQSAITGRMRATLIDWLVEVQRQFSLVLETFQLTVQIIDRYLQVVPDVQRNRLQLIGVTAMYIASKYEEIYAPDVGDFVYVTDNAYTKAELFACERHIFATIGYCLAKPIPLSFLRRFVKAAHGTSKHHHLAKYLVDLCLVEYTMSHYRPSELAAAALCLSLHLLSDKPMHEVWTPTLAFYSQYSLNHIQPIIKKIAKIVIGVETSKSKSVYKKYQDVTLAKVSDLPQLKGEAIHKVLRSPSPTSPRDYQRSNGDSGVDSSGC